MDAVLPKPKRGAIGAINDDGTRNFIHPSDVEGRYQTLRQLSAVLLIGLYVALPWIPINGHPAVFLDVAHRQFHLFGFTFTPQDLWLVFFLITGLGFTLFYLTALVGRVWCGWACPQTVFIDHVYRRIERWMEGNATERRHLDAAPWDARKILRRGAKQIVFALLSLVIAHVFISYFVSLPKLYEMIRHSPLENWSIFLAVFLLAGLLWFNFAWFREQFCIILCPYGRLQSALLDEDSVVVGYDPIRGEPRGRKGTTTGDCIDCLRCVKVCPTGIDIREGLQMECVNCAACIDACDTVMTKIDRPKGLIRYASSNELAGGKTRWIRARTILYTALLLLGAMAMTLALSTLQAFQVSALRMAGAPYYLDEGAVRNQFMLRITNKRNRPIHAEVEVFGGSSNLSWSGFQDGIDVPALSEEFRPLVVTIPRAEVDGKFPLKIEVSTRTGSTISRAVSFLGPSD